MRPARRALSTSSAIVLLVLIGCGNEPPAAPEAEGNSEPAPATTDVAPPPEAASNRGTSPDAYLPPAGDGGSLPRTLAGYTLLDPAPPTSEHAAGFPFEGSVYAWQVLRERPLEAVRAYSREGEIFRIEYSDDNAPPFAELASVARERYGKPYQDKENEIIWIKGGSTLTLRHTQNSNTTRIFIEDEDAVLAAYSY